MSFLIHYNTFKMYEESSNNTENTGDAGVEENAKFIPNFYDTTKLIKEFYEEKAKLVRTEDSSFVEPIIEKLNKKTIISNFVSVCASLGRPAEDVREFYQSNLKQNVTYFDDTTSDKYGCAMIDRIHAPKIIIGIMRSFALKFVLCPVCKSKFTTIEKQSRLSFCKCKKCGAETSLDRMAL